VGDPKAVTVVLELEMRRARAVLDRRIVYC